MKEAALSFHEAGLADDLLLQALNSFMSTGNPRDLGLLPRGAKPATPTDDVVETAARYVAARNTRLAFARTSVLFAALSAEAATNFYIAAVVPEHLRSLETLDVPKKLLLASALAETSLDLQLGKSPVSDVVRIMRLRNRIVGVDPV